MKRIFALLADESGASIIEFAVVAPVIALLSCLTADVSMGFARKLKCQQAADRAINYATMAGMNATASQLQAEAASAAGVATANVKVTFWLECDGVVQPSYTATCTTGTPARYVSVAVTDSYRMIFGTLLSASAIALRGYAEVRLQ